MIGGRVKNIAELAFGGLLVVQVSLGPDPVSSLKVKVKSQRKSKFDDLKFDPTFFLCDG